MSGAPMSPYFCCAAVPYKEEVDEVSVAVRSGFRGPPVLRSGVMPFWKAVRLVKLKLLTTPLFCVPRFDVKIIFAAPMAWELLPVAVLTPPPLYWPASTVQLSPEAGFDAKNDVSAAEGAMAWLTPG